MQQLGGSAQRGGRRRPRRHGEQRGLARRRGEPVAVVRTGGSSSDFPATDLNSKATWFGISIKSISKLLLSILTIKSV
jgi:hypothetical protein